MTLNADFSEVHKLSFDLGRASARVVPAVDAVMKRAASNVKDDMVADASKSRHFSGIARTISYDRVAGLRGIGYEVGPDRERGGQAPLAGIAYFGGVRGGGGTLDIDGPLQREAPNLDRYLGDALKGLL